MTTKILTEFKSNLLRINPKPKYITIKDIQEIMWENQNMPTAIFSTSKKDYIVKPRTIYGLKTKRKAKMIITI